MALTSTIYRFKIALSDVDRSVYEPLDFRVACHPSEEKQRLVIRVLALATCYTAGLSFGRGLSDPEDAALWSHSTTGEIDCWIDVGAPTAERLHRASKRAGTVRVLSDKPAASLQREWSRRKIHRSDAIEVMRLPPQLLDDVALMLERNNDWCVLIQDGSVAVSDSEDRVITGALSKQSLAAFLGS